jgi:hypothetical protein
VSTQFDLEEPRARSRALDALAPSVATIADPVVRAHYVQRLARLARMDERAVLALLGRRQGRRPAPLPTARELQGARREATQTATASSSGGEAGLLQLLLHREEAREVAEHLDADIFEDSVHRRLFEAWRDVPELAEAIAEADDDVRARYAELATERPGWLDPLVLDARNVAEMAQSWCDGLRHHRLATRLRPAIQGLGAEMTRARRASTSEPATDVRVFDLPSAEATLEDEGVPEAAPESRPAERAIDEVTMEVEDIMRRKRELARAIAETNGRRPALAGGDQTSGGDADQ